MTELKAELFSMSVAMDPSDPSSVTITPRNIFTALVLAGRPNPPIKTAVCSQYDDGEYIWRLSNGEVSVCPHEGVTLSIEIPKESDA